MKSSLWFLAFAFALSLVLPRAGAAPPDPLAPVSSGPPGPGAVVEMHERLFAALDRGDLEEVHTFLGQAPAAYRLAEDGSWESARGFLGYGIGAEGEAIRVDSPGDGVKALLRMGGRGRAGLRGWTTRITSAWSDCPSARISFACIEFERTRDTGDGSETARFRATSLVSHENGEWVLWHFHVSPA